MVSITDRIKQVEKFLKEQETPETPVVPLTPALIPEPTPIAPALALNDNVEVIGLLRRILINQLIERRSWERSNPIAGDERIYEWTQRTLQPGFQVNFSITVTEGQVFFMEFFNITYNADTEYEIYIDGELQGEQNPLYTLTDTPQDFGDNLPLYNPPRACYRLIEVRAANLGAIAQTYNVTFRGFSRPVEKVEKIF